jgi:hypothetical protein
LIPLAVTIAVGRRHVTNHATPVQRGIIQSEYPQLRTVPPVGFEPTQSGF